MSSLKYYHCIKSPQISSLLAVILVLALSFSIQHKANAQSKQVIQVKAFTENLSSYPNLNLSINSKQFFKLNEDGVVYVNLSSSDIPIQSIKLKDATLEVASWNLSKGILEVIIRKKSYIDKSVRVIGQNGNAVSGIEVQFSGNKNLVKETDSNGTISIPLALNEKISSAKQFEIKNFEIYSFEDAPTAILSVKKIKETVEQNELKSTKNSSASIEGISLSLEQVDTISSLRSFYDVTNRINREGLDERIQLRLDTKFDELISTMNGMNILDTTNLLHQISKNSIVEKDINKLLRQARTDNYKMLEQRALEQKIQLVHEKLKVGFENMTEESKGKLLVEIQELEQILKNNKSEFNENLNTYLAVISELKRRFFDLQDIEDRLSKSESERLKEKRIYQQRLLLTVAVAVIFAFLLILLFYFRAKLKKQKKELIAANIVVKSTNENLENVVLERTFLLNKTFKELDTVLYKASHDLRAPLSSIAGISDLLNRETNNQKLTGLLVKTNKKMDKLLKKLSTISEIHQPGKFEEIDINATCKKVYSSFDSVIENRGIDFKTNIAGNISVLSIPKLVEVIIYHLMENAFFFCWINNENHKEVILDIESKEGQLEIVVTDNGSGVDKIMQNKIFEMFNVGSEHSAGNGLGLYIVQKSVELLNGTVKVSSVKNEHTKFIVVLPTTGKGSNTLEFLGSLKA